MRSDAAATQLTVFSEKELKAMEVHFTPKYSVA